MDNVDFALPQEVSEPAKLLESIAIVKAPQRELRDFCKAGLHRLASQNAVRIQTSDMHTITPIFFEQPRKLDSLTFRAAFMKASDQMQNVSLH